MTNGNDAAYARPAMRDEKGEANRDDILSHDKKDGLTKREYFAAMAMQGLLAASGNGSGVEYDTKMLVASAVEASDALIAALNEEIK